MQCLPARDELEMSTPEVVVAAVVIPVGTTAPLPLALRAGRSQAPNASTQASK